MKMHELLSEGEKLDELNLAGIGSAIGRGLGAAGRGVAGAARAAGPIVGKAAGMAGRGIAKGAQAVGQYAPGVIKGVGDIAGAATGAVGNVAAQTAGGVAQTVSAIPGGFMHGYNVARHGGKFGAGGPMAGHEAGNWASGPANAASSSTGSFSGAGADVGSEAKPEPANANSVFASYNSLNARQKKAFLKKAGLGPQQATQTPESIEYVDLNRIIQLSDIKKTAD